MPKYSAPAQAPAAPESVAQIQQDIARVLTNTAAKRCVKCKMELISSQQACPRCGLMLNAGKPAFIRAWADPLVGHPMGETLRVRWQTLAADLHNADGHKAFISLCASQKVLTYAGHCYREILDADADNQLAENYRQLVIQAALAQAGHLDTQVGRLASGPKKSLATMGTGAIILLVFAAGYFLITQSQTAWQF
jgi:hypothetical protein